MDTLGLHCPKCDADVPFGTSGKAQCLYCLHRFDLPGDFAAALEQSRKAKEKFERLMSTLASGGPRDGKRAFLRAAATLGIVAYVGLVLYFMFVRYLIDGNLAENLAGIIPVFGPIAFLLTIPIISILVYQRAQLRSLAVLPMAEIAFEKEAELRCPECRGKMGEPDGIKLRCPYCRTVSLLPASMVSFAFKQQMRRILDEKQRAKKSSYPDFGEIFNKVAGFALIFLGFCLWGGITVFIVQDNSLADDTPPFLAYLFGAPGAIVMSIVGIRRIFYADDL